jgi:PBP1b-binding outer membrane lipoprotein LpoB
MFLLQMAARMRQFGRNSTIAAFALTLAACAPVDDSIGSHLAQPPAGTVPQKPVDAGDIAIVGQEVAHSIMDLPAVANAPIPPLVQFTGVTSIIDKPIDTDPYTELLRDRLLLLTREKLRFVEHTLPPYVPPSKKGRSRKKETPSQPVQNTTEPDYEILAELRGHAEDEFYKIQVEFVDVHTNEVLFSGLYRIRREASDQPPADSTGDTRATPAPDTTASPAPATTGNESL